MQVMREAGAGIVPRAQFAPGTHDVSGQSQLFLTPPVVRALARSEESHREAAAALQDPNPALAPRRAPGTPLPPPRPRLGAVPWHRLCSFVMFSSRNSPKR